MRATLLALFFLVAAFSACFGQESKTVAAPGALVLTDGTPIKLRIDQTVSSADAKVGDRLQFVVTKDVDVEGVTVVRTGDEAWGRVTGIRTKHLAGLGGRLIIRLDSLELGSHETATLRAIKKVNGRSHLPIISGEMLATSFFFPYAAPVFLLAHGRDSTLLKGTELTAYVNGNFVIDPAKLPPPRSNDRSSELNTILKLVPPRVLDDQGHEGDMVNLLFLGSKPLLEQAFVQSGWVKVDRSRIAATWHLLRERNHCRELPMSKLYLFGRAQDYGYALPDTRRGALLKRHHLRIWKTDYEIDGEQLWVGAATHEIGLERARRHGRITHRIDPRVDKERDFVASSLFQGDLVKHREYLSTEDPVFQARTVTGGAYYSDGKLLLIELR